MNLTLPSWRKYNQTLWNHQPLEIDWHLLKDVQKIRNEVENYGKTFINNIVKNLKSRFFLKTTIKVFK